MKVRTLAVPAPLRIKAAVCADFHSENRRMPVDGALELLRSVRPDLILFPGDIFSDTGTASVGECFNQNGLNLLLGAARIAPCFFIPGNHEMGLRPDNRRILEDAGIRVLDNEFVRMDPFVIGGLSSGYLAPKNRYNAPPGPDPDFPARFAREEGYHILLCHHPEYYPRYLLDRKIDLICAGHCHGGQWRYYSLIRKEMQGVYAPGQGLFPALTSGIHDNKLVISRGLSNNAIIPRINNPTEIVYIGRN